MLLQYARNTATTLAIATGLAGCAGNTTNVRPTETLDDLTVVDRIIDLKDQYGCLGVAATPDKAQDSYTFLCNHGYEDAQLAFSSVGSSTVVAYKPGVVSSRTN